MKRVITASQFEVDCLEVFDEVAATGQEVIITKDGRPVAMVLPVEPAETNEPGVPPAPAGRRARP